MRILFLSNHAAAPQAALPALDLLPYHIHHIPAHAMALIDTPATDLALVDARHDLAGARSLCHILTTTGSPVPLLAIATEGGTAALTSQWGITDFLLPTMSPTEVDARLRLATERTSLTHYGPDTELHAAGITIDQKTYTARLNGRALNLTYREFELLKFLLQHPGRVFTRSQLLTEIWGSDYYGGPRTIDVHIRRLRAKLGPEHESAIDTVRHVGYRLSTPETRPQAEPLTSVQKA